MAVELTLRPQPPYCLEDSVLGTAGGTRRLRGGVLELWDLVDGAPVRMRVTQRRDGALDAWVDGCGEERARERLGALLALDVDHTPFLRRAREDPLLAEPARRRPGIRPLRLPTVAHALLAAVCGQLVSGREAARLQRAVLALCTGRRDDLRLPPAQTDLAALAPASCVAAGLAARRAAALVRVARGPRLARFADRPTAHLVSAVCRERDLGPWSAGVIALYGLGRYDHGLVGDLGLVRLMAARDGRRPEAAETATLLEPYGEWAGLASVYLLQHPLARRPGPGAQARPGAPVLSAPSSEGSRPISSAISS